MTRTLLPRLPLRALACAALASTVLAGCVNLAPAYETPASPVPSNLPSAGVTTTTPLDIGWRDFFVDKQLQGVIELALANNRDLRVAALNIERARAQYGIARADLFPTVNAGAAGTRSRTPGSLSTSGESRIASQYSANLGMTAYESTCSARAQPRRIGTAGLLPDRGDAAQHADQPRGLRRHGMAATGRRRAAPAARARHAREPAQVLRAGAAQPRAWRAVGPGAGAGTEHRRCRARRRRRLRQPGRAGPQRARAAGRRHAPARAAAQRHDDRRRGAAARAPAGLSSSVLQQRPDVRAAEHALRASNADIGAARAAFFPRIALTASAGTASSTLSGLFASGSKAWSFAPSISVPIFDGGANRANLQVAQAQQKIQIATYEKAVQTAFREVADALAERRTLAERLDAQRSLRAATARSFELSQSLFKSGAANYLDVLDAQRSDYAAQQTLIGLQLTEQTNRLAIYKALGGGWSEASGTQQPAQGD